LLYEHLIHLVYIS